MTGNDRTSGVTPRVESGRGMESLRRIERTEQRLWLLALLLLVLLALSVLMLDTTSSLAERLLGGLSGRARDLLNTFGTSVALAVIVALVCAYFGEKLRAVRWQNRELVLALHESNRMLGFRTHQLHTWHRLSHTLITSFNLPPLLELIARTAAEVGESDCAAVMLVDRGNPHLRLAAIHNRGLQTELARHLANLVVERGEPICIRPGQLPPELDRPDLAWEDVVSIAAAPLMAEDAVKGVLLVGRTEPQEPFGDQVMDTVESFASQASIALEKAQLYADKEQQVRRLERVLSDLRQAQGEAAEGAPQQDRQPDDAEVD